MAKRTVNLINFEGGVNRDADPRDIRDNESAILWGWNVSDKGVLRLGGGQAVPTEGPTDNVITTNIDEDMAGHGLGYFTADYRLLNFEQEKTNYIFIADSDSKIHVHPYDATGEDSFNENLIEEFSLGTDTSPKVKYYTGDDGIRIYDAKFENNNNTNKTLLPVQYEYCKKALSINDDELLENFEGDDDNPPASAYETKQWIFGNAFIDTSNNFGHIELDPGESVENDGYFSSITKEGFLASKASGGTDTVPTSSDDMVDKRFFNFNFNSSVHSLNSGGAGLGNKVWVAFASTGEDSEDTSLKKAWNPFITFIYDEKQETAPIPVRNSGGTLVENGDPVKTTIALAGEQIRFMVGFAMIGKNATQGAEIQWDENFTYADLKTWNSRITGICLYIAEADDDQSITSDRMLFLVHEINLLTGKVRTPARSLGEQQSNLVWSSANSTFATGWDNYIQQLPGETYQTRIGYNPFGSFYKKYKTATVLNGRTYIGNVATLKEDGSIKRIYNDRIIQSPVGSYDVFPEENLIDVVYDGDEIIHLEGFSDRILQYKRNSLYIINVSQDFAFIEGTYKGLGVRHHTQVCKTPNGIAWVNDEGCHFYDGRQVVNLINTKIKRGKPLGIESTNAQRQNAPFDALFDDEGDYQEFNKWHEYLGWAAFMNSEFEDIVDGANNFQKNSMPSIGYDAASNKLIIIKSLNDRGVNKCTGWVYAYDFVNAAWTLHPGAYEPTRENFGKSNFITNSKNELILYNRAVNEDAKLSKWTDFYNNRDFVQNNSEEHQILYKSKDYDFGEPSTKKNVYKLYITYKAFNDTRIKPIFLINGYKGQRMSTSGGFSYRILSGNGQFESNEYLNDNGFKSTSGEWKRVELKFTQPSKLKNIFSFQFVMYNSNPFIPITVSNTNNNESRNITNDNFSGDFKVNDISIIYRFKGGR